MTERVSIVVLLLAFMCILCIARGFIGMDLSMAPLSVAIGAASLAGMSLVVWANAGTATASPSRAAEARSRLRM